MGGNKRTADLTVRAFAVLTALTMLSSFLVAAGCGGRPAGTLTISDVKLEASTLGKGWVLDKEVRSDPEKAQPDSTLALLAGIGAEDVLNQVFSRDGEKLQVNFVQFDSTENAADGVELFMAEEGTRNIYGVKKNIAVEIIGDSDAGKVKAAKLVGIKVEPGLTGEDAESANTRVEFGFACVNSVDYMKSNALSEYLEDYREGDTVDPEMQATIGSATFGDSVSLLTGSGSDLESEYTFEPKPVDKQTRDGVTTFKFDASGLKEKLGVP
ncbi:MAG: hypothetical protein MUO75_00615, partial [Actinobacteria bacterium]|nr:hypothetical protein [Actinomycetota bacterium]